MIFYLGSERLMDWRSQTDRQTVRNGMREANLRTRRPVPVLTLYREYQLR